MTRPIDAFTEQPPACPWKQLIAKVRYEAGQVYGRNADRYWQTKRILAVIEAHALAAANMESQLAEAKAEIERLGEVIESRHAAHAKRVNELEQQLTAAQQAKEAAEERAEKAEREHEGTLKERVECEECIDKMYLDVVGQPAQWSNNFDYKDAADMVEQVAFARDQEIGRHINAREVAESRVYELEAAIRTHWEQKADDRCWEDDSKLYAVVPLPDTTNRCIGDPAAMLENCKRFIKQRACAGGPWKSYAELEAENAKLWENDELKAGIIAEVKAEKAKLREQLAYLATDAGPDSDAAVIKQLREEVASVKRGYDQLDKNWHAVHESAMTAIRQMFCNPDATVPEICEEIGKLREKLTRVNTELNAIKAERKADLAALELNNKTLAERDKVIAAAVGYCKRHTHSGVTLSAHVCLLEVLKILEGKEWPAGTDNCGEDANCTSTVQPSSSSKAGGQA